MTTALEPRTPRPSLRTLAPVLAATVGLGAVAAVVGGQPGRLSLDLWLGAAAAWATMRALTAIRRAAPPADDDIRTIWRRRRGTAPADDLRPRDLVLLEGLLVTARDSGRASALRLRPRLRVLAAHRLRSMHGIDLEHDRDRARHVLGRSWWLVDDDELDRAPTLAELEAFADALGLETTHEEVRRP